MKSLHWNHIMNDISVIDSSSLSALQAAMGEDFAELVPIFIESTQDILTNLLKAFNQQDIESFTREAHSLKSSSANLGGLVLSEMAAGLENAGHQGQLPESEEFIRPLEETFALMEKELQQYQN
jgi:HPt (histidine-containing phosphotransfer) domain-containing protein